MPRKAFTYEQVKETFEKEGYTLLSPTYKNIFTKMDVRCPEGHEYPVRYNDFRKGGRCPHCFGNVKHTYEHIKEQVAQKGYTLTSTEYVDRYSPLEMTCNAGHSRSIDFHHFLKRHECPTCRKENKRKI